MIKKAEMTALPKQEGFSALKTSLLLCGLLCAFLVRRAGWLPLNWKRLNLSAVHDGDTLWHNLTSFPSVRVQLWTVLNSDCAHTSSRSHHRKKDSIRLFCAITQGLFALLKLWHNFWISRRFLSPLSTDSQNGAPSKYYHSPKQNSTDTADK